MTSIALPLIRTWWTCVHQMPHPSDLVLRQQPFQTSVRGVSDGESGRRLLSCYDRGVQLNTTWVSSALSRSGTKDMNRGS